MLPSNFSMLNLIINDMLMPDRGSKALVPIC